MMPLGRNVRGSEEKQCKLVYLNGLTFAIFKYLKSPKSNTEFHIFGFSKYSPCFGE
jgi:hypothetical protein